MEYILPIQDVADAWDDLDELENWRLFIKERTGVELDIYA